MARTDNLSNYLTDVASAIKEKKGDSTPISASNFDTEIRNLPSGGGETKVTFTGSYDSEGLKTIGWTDEEIQWANEKCVYWNEESNDIYKLTEEELIGEDNGRFPQKGVPASSIANNKAIIFPEISIDNYCSFNNCYGLTGIYKINMSDLLKVNSLFNNCYCLKEIPELDNNVIRKYTNLSNLFNCCYSLKKLPNIDTSKATNLTSFASNCRSLEEIPELDTSNVTNFNSAFSSCFLLKRIPKLNMQKATSMASMFGSCYSLEEISELDTSKVTSMNSMFSYCQNLVKVPTIDASSTKSLSNLFSNCLRIKDIKIINTSNVTDMSSLCAYSGITNAPELDTQNVTTMSSMLGYCKGLVTIPLYEAGKVTNISNVMGNSSVITNVGGFKDLGKAYIQKTSNYSYYSLIVNSSNITHDSLMNIINNLYDLNVTYNVSGGGTLYTQKLTISSTNLAKLTSEEILIATNKGWTVS